MTVAKYGFSLLLQQHDIIIYIIIKIFETFYISFIYQLFFFFFLPIWSFKCLQTRILSYNLCVHQYIPQLAYIRSH